MRVAFATDTYAPAVNGVVRSVETSVAMLRDLDAEVRMLAPRTTNARADRARTFPAFETRLYPGLRVAVFPVRRRDLRGVDVLHVHTPGPIGASAMLAARRAGIPVVYTHHTRFEDLVAFLGLRPARRDAVAARALAAVASRATVVAPTSAVAHELALDGVASVVIPSGVDIARFVPRPRPAAASGPVFLHMGRVSSEKNLPAVLRALPAVLREAPGARLVVGGTGPELPAARSLATRLGVAGAVHFLGLVPEHDLPGLYAAADVFVSASRFETQGLTVLEAFACGVPAALADCPVFQPHATAGAARLFDADDVADVAATMLDVAWGNAAMRGAARRRAVAHSTRAVARRLLELYGEVVGTAPGFGQVIDPVAAYT